MTYIVKEKESQVELTNVTEVAINDGAYHFYNLEDVLFYSVPVHQVKYVKLKQDA